MTALSPCYTATDCDRCNSLLQSFGVNIWMPVYMLYRNAVSESDQYIGMFVSIAWVGQKRDTLLLSISSTILLIDFQNSFTQFTGTLCGQFAIW